MCRSDLTDPHHKQPASAGFLLPMNKIEFGDCRETMRRWAADGVKAQMCVTSPPYFGLRNYGVDGQIGLEQTPEEYIAAMVEVFRCVRDVLADDGTLWLNLGSSYASGDKTPSQSLLRQRVPSCDTSGTAPQDSQGVGRACLGSYGEPQGATRCHRENNAHICRCAEQVEQQIEPTSQGSERLGCDQSSRLTFQPDAHQSTTGATSQNVQDALHLSGEALACQQEPRTSLRDAQECADKSACTFGTSRMLQPLAVHTKGKESFFSACRRSDCYGIGRCGYCFGSLTTASLNIKQKDELNIPHLVAMALQSDGWVLRQTIIWSKPNPMPESVRDRCTKAHEYIFLLSKSERYFFDNDSIREPWEGEAAKAVAMGTKEVGQRGINASARRGLTDGQTTQFRKQGHSGYFGADGKCLLNPLGANKRSVWKVATRPYKGAHFATFPPALIEPCILAGSRPGDIVLDPFMGSGTTAQVALQHERNYLGCELNTEYKPLQDERISKAIENKSPQLQLLPA